MNNRKFLVDQSYTYPNSSYLLLLSSKTESILEKFTDHVAKFLNENSYINIADFAYTLQTNQKEFDYRRMLVCRDIDDAVESLTNRNSARLLSRSVQGCPNTVTFMFPGLGEQYVNMAQELYQYEPTFRQHIIHCSEILKPLLGIDVRDILYPKGTQTETNSPEQSLIPETSPTFNLRQMVRRNQVEVDRNTQRLNQTDIAQPALFVIEYALAQMWMTWGIKPQMLIGYSLGEYVAACLAGVLSLEDALTLVVKRSQLIQSLPTGAMLAVALSPSQLQPILTEGIYLSALNGSTLSVVAGSVEAVAKLEQHLISDGIACKQIQTTHAFHSPMMEDIVEPLIDLVKTFDLKSPQIPYISNVTGKWITVEEATDPSYWAQHLCQPVRFADGIETLLQVPGQTLLEVGPGQTLGGITLQNLVNNTVHRPLVLSSLPTSYNNQLEFDFILNTVGQLWLTGLSINWSNYYGQQRYNTLNIPVDLFEQYQKEDELKPEKIPYETLNLNTHDSTEVIQHERLRLNLQNSYVAPRNDIEQKISDIWKQVFDLQEIGVFDNFFNLGGHSLIAIQIINKIKKTLEVKIPLSAIFTNLTIADLATFITNEVLIDPNIYRQQDVLDKDVEQASKKYKFVHWLTYKLKNGMEIFHQNKAETEHFYEDIYEHKVYAKNGIQFNPRDHIFDVGANIGLFTLFADQESDNLTIYSFEPSPPTFEILQANTSKCRGNIKLFNCGLSNESKTITLTFYPNSSGMSSFYPNEEEEKQVLKSIILNQKKAGMLEMEEVLQYTNELLEERFKSETFYCPVKTLSEVIAENSVNRIDMLKIDVQKSEFDVLLGINEHDWLKIRQIVIEVHDESNRLAQVDSLLKAKGYNVITEQDSLYKATNIYNLYAIRNP
ncbi:FkbM family methyltransferase [Aetokthonos hydrillicola Thurmond2011]|jgi:FkbM family methyltransferase|uniref:FkbM family methyltransferase n=1 Tax=Aetokthonos hydrillicola Thurmond2011 TaxID=2712845 RepID=A0AAP5M993_9CYAN|nr:FkbM family methyltransferase [Aetokthonos hydrillicola]MBO3459440.1 FkbM family methyltransferase [Aetokthonos hydrillicola CCALA 1050]MBW4583803.1 FkbM family methyltransferase [Aetokthonos hydrillicola CCALA 1050]MDR9895502.1 FkbM family methyltransferase [Aetokthonos hydrillicola Thurmond2011]